MTSRLKLARHREISVLKLLGWQECGEWDRSFVLMQLRGETAAEQVERAADETLSVVSYRTRQCPSNHRSQNG